MVIIISGSNNVDKYRAFYEYYKWCLSESGRMMDIGGLISGGDSGPDLVPILINDAAEHLKGDPNYNLTVEVIKMDEDRYGPSAVHIRNSEIVKKADGLFLIWDGKCKNCLSLRKVMQRANKPYWEILIKN